ncbi:RidA family protein [Undibacterium arcticum]|uniref:RidA family protein n=1 Tax=Undibacterium arcticum TaxID=1762892 RepID=UPI00361877BD
MNIQFVPPPEGVKRRQSDLVLTGPLAFASGIIGADMTNDAAPLAESVEAQARQILNNLDRLLSPHNLARGDVVAVHLWLKDFQRFHDRLERVWPEFPVRKPAYATDGRSTRLAAWRSD